MSLYQLDVVFPKENVSMSYRLEINDDERRESENDESRHAIMKVNSKMTALLF